MICYTVTENSECTRNVVRKTRPGTKKEDACEKETNMGCKYKMYISAGNFVLQHVESRKMLSFPNDKRYKIF